MLVSFAANCAADFVELLVTNAYGTPRRCQAQNALTETRDRCVSSIGHAVEIRDDAANGQGLLCLQGWDSASFETRGSYVHRLRNRCSGRPSILSCTVERRGCSELGGALWGDQEPPHAIVASGSVSNGIVGAAGNRASAALVYALQVVASCARRSKRLSARALGSSFSVAKIIEG